MADNRGSFDKMDPKKQQKIASDGGTASTGSFGDKNSANPVKAGADGAKAQPKSAKAKGGRNSHRSS